MVWWTQGRAFSLFLASSSLGGLRPVTEEVPSGAAASHLEFALEEVSQGLSVATGSRVWT